MNWFTKHRVIVILLIIVALIGGIMLFSLFKRNNQKGIDYKELVAAKDETIKVYQQEIEGLIKLRSQDSAAISQHYKNDSLLVIQSKQIQIKYEKVPIYIVSLSKDSLRSAGESAASEQ